MYPVYPTQFRADHTNEHYTENHATSEPAWSPNCDRCLDVIETMMEGVERRRQERNRNV